MSSDETRSALSRAFELVEAGDYEAARVLLEPILAAEPQNADAWWIYAHAVTNPDEGRAALEQVLRIDPNFPGATELIAIAQERYPQMASEPEAALPDAPELPPSLPEDDFPSMDEVDFADELETADEPISEPTLSQPADSRRNLFLPIAAVIAVVTVIVLILALTQGGGTPETPTPTQVVVVEGDTPIPVMEVTDEATSEVIATEPIGAAPTREPTVTPTFTPAPDETGAATAEAETLDTAAVRVALADFAFADSGIEQVSTALGETIQVSLCSAPGREMRALLPQAMQALAREEAAIPMEVSALAVRLVNCDTSDPLLTVAVDRGSARSYAEGNLNDSEFAILWQPQ